MPVRCAPGVLPAAYRVMCLEACFALARGEWVEYGHASRLSEMCKCCIYLLEDDCVPVSTLFLVLDVMRLISIDP
jgi:hypothetical protein